MKVTRKTIGILVLTALIAGAAAMVVWSRRDYVQRPQGPAAAERNPLSVGLHANLSAAAGMNDAAEVVGEFCTNCHVLPTPDCEPKDMWPAKIEEMYGYARGERRVSDKEIPPIHVPVEYFTSRAPEYLPVPEGAMGSPPSPLAFAHRMIVLDAIPGPPAVSSVKFVRLSDDGPSQLLICDMRHGLVVLWTPSRPDEPASVIGRAAHPCRTQVVDLDGDGLRDILVANLGVFWPLDTTEGSVLWLRARGKGRFESIVLLGGVNRVADVKAADFDQDGDLDLVVAIFGNLITGRIVYMENFTEDYAEPDFEAISLDEHTGTSDVLVVDLNEDGCLDFIAMQSQESERVVAFLGSKSGNFKQELIYQAPHPRWGSTGIRLFDLDGDGDQDLLFNHGDSVQVPPIPRPYHGFGWLENQGSFPFTYRRLAHLPGAHTSLPADIDGDGDLDLVSSVFIPAFNPSWPHAGLLDTVVWLEQISTGEYRRYSLETRTPFHPCADVGDYDEDGDVDIVLGNFIMRAMDEGSWESCITVLENSSVSARPKDK